MGYRLISKAIFKNGAEKGNIIFPVKCHCLEVKLMFKSTNIISMRCCNPIRSSFLLINQTTSIEVLTAALKHIGKKSKLIDIQHMAQPHKIEMDNMPDILLWNALFAV